MPLKPDFHDLIEVFIYSNLSVVINTIASPTASATNVTAVANANLPANQININTGVVTPSTTQTEIATNAQTTVIIPQRTVDLPTLSALQTVTFNNFTDLGLNSDISDITRVFFASLPPITPTVTPTVPITPTQPTTALRPLNRTPPRLAATV